MLANSSPDTPILAFPPVNLLVRWRYDFKKTLVGRDCKIYLCIANSKGKQTEKETRYQLVTKSNDELGAGRNIYFLSVLLFLFFLSDSFFQNRVSTATTASFNKPNTNTFILPVRALGSTEPRPFTCRKFHTQRSAR
jgi:hypothetical protein